LPAHLAGLEVARLRHALAGEPALVLGGGAIDLHATPHLPRRAVLRFGILVASWSAAFWFRDCRRADQLAPANLLPLLDRLGDEWWAPWR